MPKRRLRHSGKIPRERPARHTRGGALGTASPPHCLQCVIALARSLKRCLLSQGKQTLGQEYCDIALVTRPRPGIKTVAQQHTFPAPASGGAMWTYSLVRVVVPYLQVKCWWWRGPFRVRVQVSTAQVFGRRRTRVRRWPWSLPSIGFVRLGSTLVDPRVPLPSQSASRTRSSIPALFGTGSDGGV